MQLTWCSRCVETIYIGNLAMRNPPFDKNDLLLRNELLQQATRRSSLMLQQAATSHRSYSGPYPAHQPARALPTLPQGLGPTLFSPPSSMDPQHYSMLRLEMLRNQVRDTVKVQKPILGMTTLPPYHRPSALVHDALKIQNEAILRLNHQVHSVPQPRTMVSTQFIESNSLAKSLPPCNPAPPNKPVIAPPTSSSSSIPRPQKPTVHKVAKKAKAEKKAKPNKKDSKWLASLALLVEYKKEHGNCIVPRGYGPDPKLASWVAEQRKQYKLLVDGKPSSITPERVERLNELGFAWNAQDAAWDRHYADLKQFRNEFGDCLVPLGNPNYPKLGLWIKEQRRHYTLMKQGKKTHMTQERARRLDDIGFCWDTHEQIWLDRLRELCAFRAVRGDCLVPTNYQKNSKLGTWAHHQRRQYKKFQEGKPCHITIDRIRALEAIGFDWDPRSNPKRSASSEDYSDSGDSYSEASQGTHSQIHQRY